MLAPRHGSDEMEMEMPMFWLDQPVMLHSDRDAGECTMTPEQCVYKSQHWRNWYIADQVYALNTIYFFVATIAVCIIGYWLHRLAPKRLRQSGPWQRLVGTVRFLTYRRYDTGILGWRTPSLGVCALVVVGAVFFLAQTLGPHPYYWPNTKDGSVAFGDSPPLATRAGWMALACLPFMIILPTKANMIATLTGVSHERLIVFHNWIGWAMFVLALVHTFPFIVYHEWMGDMADQLSTSVVWWTGIVALILQAYLQFGSISWIRNRFYEFFKATHFIAALLFVFFFFIHCDFRLTSWDYFIAAGVLYTLSWLYSQMRTFFEYGTKRAHLEMVSDRALKITIPVGHTTWQPTQHVFLRFLTLGTHAMTAHPFTICNAPSSPSAKSSSHMVFYMHPQGGLTRRLASLATRHATGLSVPVLLDGPYGGIKNRAVTSYDRSIVVACGSGAPLSLPLVMDALLRLRWRRENPGSGHGEEKPVRQQHNMRVIIATRDADLVTWYEDALLGFMEDNKLEVSLEGISISVYLTGAESSNSASIMASGDASSVDAEKKGASRDESAVEASRSNSQHDGQRQHQLPIEVLRGRPDLCFLVREATMEPGITLGVVACGPEGVMKNVQNEAAQAQLRILGSKSGASEVYLHSEVFSW